MRPELKYIGKQVTIRAIKNSILDFGLNDYDTIFLNPTNFDDIF